MPAPDADRYTRGAHCRRRRNAMGLSLREVGAAMPQPVPSRSIYAAERGQRAESFIDSLEATLDAFARGDLAPATCKRKPERVQFQDVCEGCGGEIVSLQYRPRARIFVLCAPCAAIDMVPAVPTVRRTACGATWR